MSMTVLPLTLEEQAALMLENTMLRYFTTLSLKDQTELKQNIHRIMNDFSEKRRLEDIHFTDTISHPAVML